MGKSTVGGIEKADRLVQAALVAPGTFTDWLEFTGTANLAVWGDGAGSVILERSFDGGTTAIPATNLGAAVTFTGPASEVIMSREAGVLHRLRCTARTAGTFNCRISQ